MPFRDTKDVFAGPWQRARIWEDLCNAVQAGDLHLGLIYAYPLSSVWQRTDSL